MCKWFHLIRNWFSPLRIGQMEEGKRCGGEGWEYVGSIGRKRPGNLVNGKRASEREGGGGGGGGRGERRERERERERTPPLSKA